MLTGTFAVRTEVAWIGHRATQDVRHTRTVWRRHNARDPQGSGASRTLLRVLQFRRPFQVRLLREACLTQARDVSAVCTIKEAKWKRIRLSWRGGILRCETDQVKGRHPYIVTWAAVLRRSFYAHER